MPRLEIALFGSLHVLVNGETSRPFATNKARALVAYLAVERERPIERDYLAGFLWPDVTQSAARNNLRQALSQVRRAIGDRKFDPPFVLATRQTVQFNRSAEISVDVAQFEQLARAGDATALDLYRGDFLAQFSLPDSDLFESWALMQRESLQRQAQSLLAQAVASALTDGAYERAIGLAQRQLGFDGWDESAHRALMQAYSQLGRREEALRQYQLCKQLLVDELGVEPLAETTALFEQIKQETQKVASPKTVVQKQVVRHNLPTFNLPTIGRKSERTHLNDLLNDSKCRLVTLIGLGGVGKTRLSVAVGHEQIANFDDGVWFVPLADSENVANQIANTLVIPLSDDGDPRRQITAYLRSKQCLLILDNFEHLVNDATWLSALLTDAPHIKVLITSRLRLRLREEWVFAVGGLPVPADEREETDAVRLFVEAAQRSDANFRPKDRHAIMQICQLVAGHPLGLALAAGWVALLSCREIADEIATGLDLLTSDDRNIPDRHRSLQAVFDATWQFLSPREQKTLARLGVFRGVFSRQAAEAITGGSLLDLMQLSNKSLLQRDGEFLSLHPTVRQYAEGKLSAAEHVQTQQTHKTFYLDFLSTQEVALQGHDQITAIAQIRTHIDNIRTAWYTAVNTCDQTYLQDALFTLVHFYAINSWNRAGQRLLQSSLNELPNGSDWHTLRARIAAYLAWFSFLLGETTASLSLFATNIPILRQALPPTAITLHLAHYAHAINRKGDHEQAVALLEQAHQFAQDANDRFTEGLVLSHLCEITMQRGHFIKAREIGDKALALLKAVGNRLDERNALLSLGRVTIRQGDYAAAKGYLEASLAICEAVNDQRNAGIASRLLGIVAFDASDYETAERYYLSAEKRAIMIGDRQNEAAALNNLGLTYRGQDLHDKAQAVFERSLAIRHEINDKRGKALVLGNLGALYRSRQRYADAQITLGQSSKLRRALGDKFAISATDMALGLLSFEIGNYEQATVHWQQCYDLRTQMGEKLGAGYAHSDLALLALYAGEYERCRQMSEHDLAQANELDIVQYKVLAHTNLGHLYRTVGDVERAIQHYEAVQVLTTNRLQKDVSRVLAGLAVLALEHKNTHILPHYAEQLLTILEPKGLPGVLEANWVYWVCYRVLRELEDGRARPFLKRTYRRLISAETHLTPQQRRHWYQVEAHCNIHRAMRNVNRNP